MVLAARCREADRAGECASKLALHRFEVVVVGSVLERALAHHIGPERRMPDVDGGVDPLRRPIEHLEVLREALPLD